ncbi:MAG: DinB family protein [Ginsengibacter sp.]
MAADKPGIKELFVLLDSATSELLKLISLLSEKELNTIPFEDSWTAAQLTSHVTKSNKAILQALNMEGMAAERNAGERVEELKTTFLDLSTKFKSPEFILPTLDVYQKDMLVRSFEKSIGQLKEGAAKVNLSEMIIIPAFGEITKLELLHFVLYHTQRHLYQFKNIFKVIHNNSGFIDGTDITHN